MTQNYFLLKYTSKTLLDVRIYTCIGIETTTNDQAVILGVSVFEFTVLFVVNDDTCNDDALSSSSSSTSS